MTGFSVWPHHEFAEDRATLRRPATDGGLPQLELTVTATDGCIQTAPSAVTYRYGATIDPLPPRRYRVRVRHVLARNYETALERRTVRVVADTTIAVPE